MKFNIFFTLIILTIFCLVADVYEVNASTIKLKSTFWAHAINVRGEIYDCDSYNDAWENGDLYLTSNQSECLVFSTSVSLSKYCFHFHIYKNDQYIENIDNSQDTCYKVDGSESNWSLSSIDCGEIPSNIVNCDQ
ncbi:13966_t:CDS:2 [Acaulospora morrowiae]|uniref:13966_t:CDS:1 n=1 Tax=Acaulospora morrowiae TaxID=94023 RepID=A0A9N8VN17_9GLOM|nr:13966_t:CDS:2 [Acaulospora morrowiae]